LEIFGTMMLCEFMKSPAVWLLTPSRASPLPQGSQSLTHPVYI